MPRSLFLTFFSFHLVFFAFGQRPSWSSGQGDLFGAKYVFIENVGQYPDSMAMRLGMGRIRYGYEGAGQPVYFTNRGVIYIQRRSVVTMRWLHGNPHVEVVKKEAKKARCVYGLLSHSAGRYGRILYKDLYPGIDVEYSTVTGRAGFEYTVRVRAGADPTAICVSYGGNVRSVSDSSGALLVRSESGTIVETKPVSYYADATGKTDGDLIEVAHNVRDKVRGFVFKRQYDRQRDLIIDPFVTSTLAGLTGINAGKAMEVDYDNKGDVYVQGGTDLQGQIAKYDPAGNLLWTFSGSLPSVGWVYGDNYGGWTVEKTTGNVYVGIGSNGFGGSVIRLNGATGLYDNFKTGYFQDNDGHNGENWKMRWFCNQGTPQVMIAGGSGGIGDYNSNIGILLLPTTNFYSYNITGITTYPYNQDVSDFVIDPANNDIYCILASGNTPFVNNRIYRNSYPYTAANQVWNTLSGYPVLQEDANTPYMTLDPSIGGSNLTNILAVNSSNLFYYDGAHLKALDKATGATVGTPVIFAGSTPLMEEGIYADECNNIFIGMPNGVIKVLKWTGSVFDDAADADITIPGYSGNSVYALAYDPARQLLYAAGNGFVGSFDISGYCASSTPTASYTLSALGVCSEIEASLSPAPPTGATVTFTLSEGSTVVATNSSGVFSGLTGIGVYTVKADIDLGCSDITESANVSLEPLNPGIREQAACGGPGTGSLTVMTGGLTNVTYSIDGVNFQTDSVFPDLNAGNYTITVDGPGCKASVPAVVSGNDLTVKATGAATVCKGASVTLQGSTNGTGIVWTPSVGLSDTTTADPVATPPVTTKYYFQATKGECTLADSVVVTINQLPVANAGANTTICYNQNATLQGSGGGTYSWSPVLYLSNATIADPEVIAPPGSMSYVLRVTDAEGCQSLPDTVSVIVLPKAVVFAGDDTTILVGQPLELYATDVNGTGFTQFSWSPVTDLNNPGIQNPVANPAVDITYTVTASTPQGCAASGSMEVIVIKGVILTVPSGFTPDGNGHNDVLRVLAAGIRKLDYFAVFNRWGQEVFRTSNLSEGWDGRMHGEAMPTGTYVWTLEAVDIAGKVRAENGTVLLIR